MSPCGGLVVTPDTVAGIIVAEDTATDIAKTGNIGGVSIIAGDVDCCGETALRVGVRYDGQWLYDGSLQYDATVN